jgi:hypothetical protein
MAVFSLPRLKAKPRAALRTGAVKTAIPRGFQPGDYKASVCRTLQAQSPVCTV